MVWSSPGALLGPPIAVYLKCNGIAPSDASGQYTWAGIKAFLARRTDLNTGLFAALEQAGSQIDEISPGIQAVSVCLQYLGADGRAASVVEQLFRSFKGDIATYATNVSLLNTIPTLVESLNQSSQP